jgi:flagellar FliL protein
MAEEPLEVISEGGKGKKRKRGLLLILGVFLFLGVGSGFIIFLMPSFLPQSVRFWDSKEPPEKEKVAHVKTQNYIYEIEPFIVNLADLDSPKYLKMRIHMESNETKGNEEFERRLPQLRDAVLTILTSKTYKEIYDSEGKKRLKEEILLRANQLFVQFKVKMVYFTEFVVQ